MSTQPRAALRPPTFAPPLIGLALALLLGACAADPGDRAVLASASQPAAAPQALAQNLAQDPEAWLRENYIKSEHMVPMRDGTRLFTAVYRPKDATRQHPVLLHRTPYSSAPYGPDQFRTRLGPAQDYVQDGYIFVYQDVRGRYLSEGQFVNMRPHIPDKQGPDKQGPEKQGHTDFDESTDCHDTIEWILKNVPTNNGRVGMWGISYPGFYSAASMIDAHPALVAVSPQAPIADWWYDDFHHHGALFLPHGFNFLSSFGQPRPEPTTQGGRRPFEYPTVDGYDFYLNHVGPLETLRSDRYIGHGVDFWNQIVEHHSYDDFWQSRNILPHLRRVAKNVLTVGGWFDAEDLYGPLQIYRSIEANNPGSFNAIVMGPWRHGGWARGPADSLGDAYFSAGINDFYLRHIEKRFFDHHLKGLPGDPGIPEAFMYETGRNRWHAFDQWPPSGLQQRALHTHPGGSLAFEPPAPQRIAYDEFVSDPAKPVPYTEAVTVGMAATYMTEDQRFASSRPDVLVFQTEPLQEDLTIAGPLTADLWVSTSGTDSDWVVKLIDVLPGLHDDFPSVREGKRTGGAHLMVRSEVIRGRFRGGHDRPEPFVPNVPTNVTLPLQDVLHTFKKGHRIMIHVQSTWFPLVDRNPQKFLDNPYLAKAQDFIKATQRVHRSEQHQTKLLFGTLEESQLLRTVDPRFQPTQLNAAR